MITECPECRARFVVDESRIPEGGATVRCSKCSAVFMVHPSGKVEVAAAAAAVSADGPCKVLVANEDPQVCDVVDGVLKGMNVLTLRAYDGVAALDITEKERPRVVILDVALPKLYGFEVCGHIKGNESLSDVKVILMPSVYDSTRYKRNPASLYGADDYVERHHVEDMLPSKIVALVPEAAAGAAPPKVEIRPPDKETEELLSASTQVIEKDDGDVHAKARKLARVIVSDILLYNSDTLEEGLRSGNFYEVIKDDIKDGVKYYQKRVPKGIPIKEYLKEAFEELLTKKREEMGL